MAPVDPLKIATTLPGKMATIVADTASTGAIQDTIKTEGNQNSKTPDTKTAQNHADTISFVSGANQSVHASGNRGTTQKSSEPRGYKPQDRVKDLSKLLSGGATVVGTDDDTFEQVMRSVKSVDDAIAYIDDKNNPLYKNKEFNAEKNTSVFVVAGLVKQSKNKNEKAESTNFTYSDNLPEDDSNLFGEKKPNDKSLVVTYSSRGEINKPSFTGEKLYYNG